MKLADKIGYGVGTVAPIIYWVSCSFTAAARDPFITTVDLLVLSIVTFMTVLYALNIFKNHSLSNGAKFCWSLLLLTMSMFPMTYYWYRYIWKGDGGLSRGGE